jgi:hypothetical protein
MLKNYSRVRLVTDDYKNEGVSGGAVGYIIETYDDGVYEVEFSKPGGTTAALLTLEESELESAEFSASESPIILEPDVREYFPDSDAVNRALRSLIPVHQSQVQAERG